MNLKKALDGDLKIKIVRFFQKNPTTIDTPKGIATWVDADLQETESALEALAKAKVLITHKSSSTVAYAYTQDKRVINLIEEILKNTP